MSAMDDAMAKLATAVEAAKAKAVEDFRAANQAPDPQSLIDQKEADDAARVDAFADQLSPPA